MHKLQQGKRSVEEYSAEFFWLLRRVDLQDSGQQMAARFVGGLRQKKIKDTLNLFNPLTLAEAHQKALIMEAQTKGDIWRERADNFTLYWCLTGFCFTTGFFGLLLIHELSVKK